jgi:hypothetical protein
MDTKYRNQDILLLYIKLNVHFPFQNPENCDSARKLVCNLNKGCGYGCQVNPIV